MFTTKGFTLLELLITIGIISILSGITIVAVNPKEQFAKANDAQRTNDVNTLISAIGQYMVKHRGDYPAVITSNYKYIANTGTGADICADLLDGNFVNMLPVDPSMSNTDPVVDCDSSYDTGYQVKFENQHISVHAPHAQSEDDITMTY